MKWVGIQISPWNEDDRHELDDSTCQSITSVTMLHKIAFDVSHSGELLIDFIFIPREMHSATL